MHSALSHPALLVCTSQKLLEQLQKKLKMQTNEIILDITLSVIKPGKQHLSFNKLSCNTKGSLFILSKFTCELIKSAWYVLVFILW